MMKVTIVLVATFVASSCLLKTADADFMDDIERLVEKPSQSKAEPIIKDSHVGYDLHQDFFYFDDDLVKMSTKRSNFFSTTRITLAGQNPDLSERKVKDAVHPFGVAQKCVSRFAESLDRWDVKENPSGHQFLALYNGQNSGFVVNKLRALLLTRLVNELNEYLPLLDRTVSEKVDESKSKSIDTFKEHIKEIITGIFRDVDRNILEQQEASDSSSASATVVIITHEFVITVNLGEGSVLAYDGTQRINYLTDASPRAQDVFGLRSEKTPDFNIEPVVKIQPRKFRDENDEDDDDLYELQFLVLQTPSVSKLMHPLEVQDVVLGEIKNLGAQPKREQYIYSNSVERLTQMAASKLRWTKRYSNPDHTVMLVGLERDYSEIH